MCFEYGFFNLVKVDGDEKCGFRVEIVAGINGGKPMCEKAKRQKAERQAERQARQPKAKQQARRPKVWKQ